MTVDRSDEDRARALQELSALADGEADVGALGSACTRWRTDAELRASWHAYHLIGDVMRSEELASDARRDLAFMNTLRERMTAEPVILAPAVQVAAARRSPAWSWKTPAAVAAGFIAVAGALVATNGTPPAAGRPDMLAQSLGGTSSGNAGADGMPAGGEPTLLVADGQLVRDARLQRYLTAHKQFDGSSALGVSSGFLRAATSQALDR